MAPGLKRSLLASATTLLPAVLAAASAEPVVLLADGQRREIAVLIRGGAEMVPLEPVLSGLGVVTRADPAGALALSYEGREAKLYARKSLASVEGDLRLLSAPTLLEGSQWLVPVDAIPRVLGPLLARRAEWRPASRVLILGDVKIPRITVSTFVSGESVRVVLEASEKVPFRVQQQEGRVTVSVPRDLVDVGFTQERLTGGIVDWVQFLGGRENLFAVTLGRRFHEMKALEQDAPARLVLEFVAAPTAARAKEATPAPRPSPEAPAGTRTIVLDPGHGGDEVGARGPSGALEKDVTLAIARKLRAAIVNGLGYHVFLTRDRDELVALDDRTAIANNYKADLFVSIHANASRSHGASGSEVYFLSYQASDDESRRLAQFEGEVVPPGTLVPADSELSLILWDMAQAEHLEESSALASRIQEELAEVTGSGGRGVKQAPFRVLVGAAMPAVLVEVAFISHPEEEKLLGSEAYQGKIAAALLRGIARYESERGRRAAHATGSVPASP
jgi:N-acetylmuramoyl-L-alanine amidase